jgi:hypothetical protein
MRGDMEAVFESWIGQPVIMRLAVGYIRVSLRCIVLKEQMETLLLRTENGPDLEINKNTVLAIEEARVHGNDRQSVAIESAHNLFRITTKRQTPPAGQRTSRRLPSPWPYTT